jgi:homoaconitate hydratase
MGQTMIEKIAEAHLVEPPARRVRAGDMVSLRPRHVLTHDNTAAVLKKFVSLGGRAVRDRQQPVIALDHEIQSRDADTLEKYRRIEAFARHEGLDFHAAGSGIGHQLMVQEGYVVPGALVVASDSHANMYGALGAAGTPVVRTDAAGIWATGDFWWRVPPTVQVVLEGALRPGVTAKDVILTLCGRYDRDEVLNAALEFAGPGVTTLDMDGRLTIANMTTEWGALAAWFPVDWKTIRYLADRLVALALRGVRRYSAEDVREWAVRPPRPDADASYAGRITLDLKTVVPQVAGPDAVGVTRPLSAAARERLPVQKAYLVSCVNSRLSDLEAAARVVRGQRVAPGVRFYVAAASREVQQAAEASGAWAALLKAGAIPLPSGCGPCIGLGEGLLEAGETAISATNRNFTGRMGSREGRVYLASPEVVAASAMAGYVTGPSVGNGHAPEYRCERLAAAAAPTETVAVLDGFPARIRGRLLFVPADGLNTDGIYGKEHTYRELEPGDMALAVMANHDPDFARVVECGDVLVGGANFGTGSSREQAATALMAAGVRLIIAASFSDTYLRNAYNNGLPCIECSALVDWLRGRYQAEIEGGSRTIVTEEALDVDFARGVVTVGERSFGFAPLGALPQRLLVAGGLERLVRFRLEADA